MKCGCRIRKMSVLPDDVICVSHSDDFDVGS